MINKKEFVKRMELSVSRELELRTPPLPGACGEGNGVAKHKIERLRLSHGQRAMWFLYQQAGKSYGYNVSFAWEPLGDFDRRLFVEVLRALTARHPVWRSTFALVDDEPTQFVHEDMPLCFREIDAADWDDGRLKVGLMDEHRRPFRLEHEPPVEWLLFNRGGGRYITNLRFHHIAGDLWSIMTVMNEIRELYTAKRQGRNVQLAPLEENSSSYVDWQAKLLATRGNELRDFWNSQLSGVVPVLNMPTDKPRPPIFSFQEDEHRFVLDKGLTDKISLVASQLGLGLFDLFMSAYQVLIHRYSGQEDVLVLAPSAGRGQRFSGVFGYFVNSLLFRGYLSSNEPFRSFIKRNSGIIQDVLRHRDYPLPLLVQEHCKERDPSRAPLYQTMMVWENCNRFHNRDVPMVTMGEEEPDDRPELWNMGDITWRREPVLIPTGQFDISLKISKVQTDFYGVVNYNTALFEHDTAVRFADSFLHLLKGIGENPETLIGDLPIMSEAVRRHVLYDWNSDRPRFNLEEALHHLISRQVEAFPDKQAAAYSDGMGADDVISYKELNQKADALAHLLRGRGAGVDGLVGICIPRSLEMVTAVLAVLRTGAAYVPLDPEYPEERIAFISQDAGLTALITTHSLKDRFAGLETDLVVVDQLALPADSEPQEVIPRHSSVDRLGYVIYTSGSTGRPKGVAMRLGALTNLILAHKMDERLGVAAGTLQFASICFDVHFQELFGTWCMGGCLYVVSEALRRDPVQLVRFLREQKVERIFLPFVALQQLADAASDLGVVVESMRDVVTAGEQLHVTESVRRFCGGPDDVWLHNHYGPSEAHVVTALSMSGDPGSWPLLPNIGTPVSNCQIYILNEGLRVAPIGVIGRLYIGGTCLARGYFNAPDMTAERFTPNPFGGEGERLYNSGDLARFLPDGGIEFLGRADHQVKVRGFRIELGEIEATLSAYPAVREAVVLAREDKPGDKRLVAYYLADTSKKVPRIEDLRGFLKDRLPEYMIPATFMCREAFALTPSGKIDRKALPKPDWDQLPSSESYVPPRNAVEKLLVRIWENVLNIKKVGVYDDFFTIGGHSLLVYRVLSRVHQALKVEIPQVSFFKTPTVAELARLVETVRNSLEQINANEELIGDDREEVTL